MFTPQVVLEARDWLRRGNPRQAAAVLLPACQQRHRDVAAVRQEVCAALIQTARAERDQDALWAAWEAIELAEQVLPLVGEGRVLREQLARQVQQRQARRETIQEIAEQAQRWLAQGQVREAIRLIEQFFRSETNPAHSVTDWKLHQILQQALALRQSLEERVAQVREMLEQRQFRSAWQLCQHAPPEIRVSPEVAYLQRQAAAGLCRERLAEARKHAQAGDVARAREYLARSAKYAQDDAALSDERAEVLALIEQVERQQQQAARKAEQQRRLSELVAAIERADLPAAYQQLYAAYQVVDHGHPQLVQLVQRLRELEQQHSASPAQPRPVRDREARIVLNKSWLILSSDEVVVGGRGSKRANFPLSGCLPARHAMLVRERGGYALQLMAGEENRVWVNDKLAQPGQRLVHGDRIVWGEAPGEWHFQLPVRGSMTATLVLEDLDGAAVSLTHGCVRQVLLLAEEGVLAGQPGKGVHGVVPGLPGRLRLVWKPEGLTWEVEGTCVRGAGTEEMCGGLLCVPSEWVLEEEKSNGAMSEAEWLRQALRRGGSSGTPRLRWSWA